MTDSTVNPAIMCFLEHLKEQGFKEARIYIYACKTMSCHVQNQKSEKYQYGEDISYFIEAFWKKDYCSLSTDSLKDEEEIIKSLKDSAGIVTVPYKLTMNMKSQDLCGRRWHDIKKDELIRVLKSAERAALDCACVTFVQNCEYNQFEETIALIDENGNCLMDDNGDCSVTIRAIARDGESVSASTKCTVVDPKDFAAIEQKACAMAKRAGKYARFGLHAKKLPSGNYPVVIENIVMAELMSHYLPVFYADNFRNNQSALSGKEGTRVASKAFCLTEDPFSEKGTCRRRIDDEGSTVSKKDLLKDGYLKQLLYDKMTASKEGRESTGNAFKPNITGAIGIRATNVILTAAEQACTRKEIIQKSEGGIYLTKLEGVFAGVNTENGDFSILASGNLIRDGKVSDAVNQFTISGNLLELWKDVEMVGNDLEYYEMDGTCMLCPTVKVKNLVISGS